MIIPSRGYERRPPFRDARKLFIVCEGRRREYEYFRYFQEMDSRIDIQIHELDPHENNSPAGLLQLACELDIEDLDEVWIVLDRDPDKLDSRKPQIEDIRQDCASEAKLEAVVSNPCFEVWLCYHHSTLLIDAATENSKGNYASDSTDEPLTGSTQVFRLASSILPLVGERIRERKRDLGL
jgi:hypothetical protein